MNYSYDVTLVCVSILVAVAGAYACFDLVIRLQRTVGPKRRNWLALAALAIGGSIWAMHFIAMLAVKLPTSMHYDVLTTLVSGLVAILMTAVALAIVSSTKINLSRIVLGGTIMGIGVTTMHYAGMSGMRGNFSLSYHSGWLITSILIGILASILSLWLVMGLQLKGVLRRLTSALVMGFSIAALHYTGMYGTQFEAAETLTLFTQPILSPFTLGLITALVTFGLLGWSVLMFLPDSSADTASKQAAFGSLANGEQPGENEPQTATNQEQKQTTTESVEPRLVETKKHQDAAQDEEGLTSTRIPIQRNKKTYFISPSELSGISADGHYTTVRTMDGQSHFCNIGFNKLLSELQLPNLTRVHRSHAIDIDCVVSFQRMKDKAVVTLVRSDVEIPVSRTHVASVQHELGIAKVTQRS